MRWSLSTNHRTRIDRVVMVHRAMALFMALLLIFTIVWLRARLLNPWKQLLAMARAVTARDFTQRTHISGRNEMAMLGQALNTMSEELSESYAVLEQRVQEKRPGWSRKTKSSRSCGRPTAVCMQVPLCERLSPVLNGLQNLTLLHDLSCGFTTWKMKKIIRSLPVSRTCPAMTKAAIFARAACRR
jgi:two-component system nitrate/nitrite sensor histidine kinase NarX